MACGGGGKASQGQGLWMGGSRRSVVGRAAAGWGGGGLALNKGPQLGFHNDIGRGQAEPSAVQMGKLRRGLLQCLRREGPPMSYSRPFIFPMKTL